MHISEFKYAVSGFEIFGRRQKNGKIKILDKEYDEFPLEITLLDITYTLESVIRNRDERPNLTPKDPGYNIEWGQYC